MQAPSIPQDEDQRIEILRSFEILDAEPIPALDQLTTLLAQYLKVPIALVSLIDTERQWFLSNCGLNAKETPRSISFCGHAVAEAAPLIVPDAKADSRFLDNPLVLGDPEIRFYAGFPLVTRERKILGTLCVIDRNIRHLSQEEYVFMESLSLAVMALLESHRAQHVLRQEQSLVEFFLQAATDAIVFLNENECIFRTNQAASLLLESPSSELWNSPIRNYLSMNLQPSGHPLETVVKTSKGEVIPCEISLGHWKTQSKKFTTLIIRDIRIRKNIELQHQYYLQKVFAQLQIGSIVLDSKHNIVFANLFDHPLATGGAWHNAFPMDWPYLNALESLLSMPELSRHKVEISLPWHDTPAWVQVDVRDDPMDSSKKIIYFYDNTLQHRLNAHLKENSRMGMLGQSSVMTSVQEMIQRVAPGDWTVLIEGETGTGKELVARAIHRASARANHPFVAVNCAGLTESLLGSQLFGYAKGAFTGAQSDREGYFESAQGGTLFLDEIGDVSPGVQVALLRVLQEREVTRIGEVKPRPINVRIILATHRNLAQRVAEGLFREDLFYRIRSARLNIPPLRERPEDIPILIQGMLLDEKVIGCKKITGISDGALDLLENYSWPGNVRELRGVVEYAVIHCNGTVIEENDLPQEILQPTTPIQSSTALTSEKEKIQKALQICGGNKAKAARLLKMGRSTFYRKMEALKRLPRGSIDILDEVP